MEPGTLRSLLRLADANGLTILKTTKFVAENLEGTLKQSFQPEPIQNSLNVLSNKNN